MKTIGIIGGLGPESTADYYREIIAAYNAKHSGLAYPEIIIFSVRFNTFLELIDAKQWDQLTALLLDKIYALQRAGADFAVIASNTPHIVFEQLRKKSPIPLLSIVEATCNKAKRMGLKKVGLLGTQLTMASDFYQKPFQAQGIAMTVPSTEEQHLIHQRIFSEIELGIFKDSTRSELLAVIKRMIAEDGIDGLILGCTELPLILTEPSFGIPFLNTAAIHCDNIVAFTGEQ